MEEGLSLGEARDAAFMLTGEGMWVGKPAYLAADPLTVQEGWQTIAQAVADCQIRVRGARCPCINPLTPLALQFDHGHNPPQRVSQVMPMPTDKHCLSSLQRTGIIIGVEEIRCHNSLNYPHLHQLGGLRVIGVQYQLLHLCCHCQIGQKDPDIPSRIDDEGRMGPTWRSTCPYLRTKMQKMPSPTKVGDGI